MFLFVAEGKPVDANQELFALGLCSIANSMFHSYPGNGSLSRSAVNNSSGVRTTFGGFYTGLVELDNLFDSMMKFKHPSYHFRLRDSCPLVQEVLKSKAKQNSSAATPLDNYRILTHWLITNSSRSRKFLSTYRKCKILRYAGRLGKIIVARYIR